MANNLRLKVLTEGEVSSIYEKCVDFLSNKRWIKIDDHPQALKMLDKAGAQVDFDNERVRFPRDVIEEALGTVSRNFKLAGQTEEKDLTFPHASGLFYTGNSTGCRLYVEPGTNNYRNVTLADIAHYGQLTEVLDEIDTCSFLTPMDMPGETADIHALKAIFENTSKHIIIQPFSFESIEYLFELSAAIAGGKDTLKERPVSDMFACSVTPCLFKAMDVEVIIQACRLGVPVRAFSLPSAGATAPITIIGTVLQASIETLSQLVMSQMFRPGIPVIHGLGPYTLDMQTGRVAGQNVETLLIIAAFVQFTKEAFQIPTATGGFGTESFIPDGQTTIEATLKALLTTLTGSDNIGNAGRLNTNLAMSPVQMIVDSKIVKILKRLISGITVDDDTLAWKEILETEPGGHYLELAHTLRHCREALRTELFVNQPREVWEAEGRKDLHARAVEQYMELKKKLQPRQLPDEVKRELDRIVKHADEHLVK